MLSRLNVMCATCLLVGNPFHCQPLRKQLKRAEDSGRLQDDWIREQIQRRHSGQVDSHAKQAAELKEKLQEAQDELDSIRRDLTAAEKHAAEAEKMLHRY